MNLNYKQLAFVLNIKPIHALEHIISAHCRDEGITPPSVCEKATEYLFNFDEQGRKTTRNELPDSMDVKALSDYLKIDLLIPLNDIQENYLKRPAAKKWLLCDYPEKELALKPKHKVKLPPALRSLLNAETLATVKNEWSTRYGINL